MEGLPPTSDPTRIGLDRAISAAMDAGKPLHALKIISQQLRGRPATRKDLRDLVELYAILGEPENLVLECQRALASERDCWFATWMAIGLDALGQGAEAAKLIVAADALAGDRLALDNEIRRRARLNEATEASAHPTDPAHPADRGAIEVVSTFYGEAFCRTASRIMLPSLYGCNPDFRDANTITHRFFIRACERPLMEAAWSVLRESGVNVVVDDTLLDRIADLPAGRRYHLHLPYRQAFQAAYEAGRAVLIAPPDHVFGSGLQQQLARLPKGGLLVAGHARIDWEKAVAPLSEAPCTPANANLVRLSLEDYRHPMVQFGLENPNPYWTANRQGDSVDVRFKEPPPLFIDPVPDLIALMDHGSYIGPYETLDHDLVEYTFRRDRLAWVDSSDAFFWAELTAPEDYAPTTLNLYLTRSSLHFARTPLFWRVG
ncbi:MAG: hypothetical protein ACPGOV_12305 [Magnetovibrionaceae bacterium]